MNLQGILVRLVFKFRIWRLRKAGLVMAEDCRMSSLPSFGSEPYLITIGRHVAIAEDVSFITHDGGTYVFREKERYRNVIKFGRINVLDNCVIGQRVILLPGVTIGPDTVIAAGSVVSRNIPPGVLAAGNPAKPVMTIHQYAEWALAATPAYDRADYVANKRAFLQKMHMRGSPKRPPSRSEAPQTPVPPRIEAPPTPMPARSETPEIQPSPR